jgi:hypothetical protein
MEDAKWRNNLQQDWTMSTTQQLPKPAPRVYVTGGQCRKGANIYDRHSFSPMGQCRVCLAWLPPIQKRKP